MTGKKFYEENYRNIVNCLKETGHHIIVGDVLSKTREDIDKKSREERRAFQSSMEQCCEKRRFLYITTLLLLILLYFSSIINLWRKELENQRLMLLAKF